MHRLAATPGGDIEREGIVSLGQTPGQIVLLSAQDTDLALLARCAESLPEHYPSVRLANLLYLKSPAAFDLYLNEVLQHAQLVIASLLGGCAYWRYQSEQLLALAECGDIRLALLPGDDRIDSELLASGNVDHEIATTLWRYLRAGGADNARQFFAYIGTQCLSLADVPAAPPRPPQPLPHTQLYDPQQDHPDLDHCRRDWRPGAPATAVLFYRAHLQAGNTQAIDGLLAALRSAGVNPLAIATASLKESHCLEVVNQLCARASIDLILNTTGFAIAARTGAVLTADVPVLQVILAGNNVEDWRDHQHGLRAADMAMNIALPEMDGRVITRAVSFKDFIQRAERSQIDVVGYRLQADRANFVAELSARWCQLRQTPNADKRIALILANYPGKDGRIGNGVGLDTPASVLALLQALRSAGYTLGDIPTDGSALMRQLSRAITNDLDAQALRPAQQSLSLSDYQRHFDALPQTNRQAVLDRWGEPADDPKVRQRRIMIAGHRCGHIFIGIQPTRGYDVDPSANYHSPDLVPPHSYLAFYFWLRYHWRSNALLHVGKHGNLEWLPGKSLALSATCWPEVALGPMPHLYPFIVNDPGEGAQAKRRAQAVIIDHLTPAMTRAETYGELQAIEALLDEYYQALGLDQRRTDYLRGQIIERSRSSQLYRESGLTDGAAEEEVLVKLDAYLCTLKESQIRSGLHILGRSLQGQARSDMLAALVRLPRAGNRPEDASLLQALADDLQLDQDYQPLHSDPAEPWRGARPALLMDRAVPEGNESLWRSAGDTRERLERLAIELIEGRHAEAHLPASRAILRALHADLAPRLDACGAQEIEQTLRGLAGRFVPPGASGAPTRGRHDVLPTGRNFFSVDTRAIPSLAAWQLACLAADALLRRYLQEHGEYPKTLGLSVWGTATMRTGGDDIAQAMALLGVRPQWALGSARVSGFEVIPASLLGRPRVDVTLRISGFFRDAFANVIELFDAAVQRVASLDEPAELNPLRAHVHEACTRHQQAGLDEKEARKRAAWRVFGAKPGAYGAGLQGLIDAGNWRDGGDLARAYIQWSGYAYGGNGAGEAAEDSFRERLAQMQVVLQNQDNREHDILDSDDYYQFQGGLHNAVTVISGEAPSTYHGDHANPAAPKIYSLEEELQRVIRSRAVNPKWLASIRQHGYKGAFEMAATVDYLFAYDATTGLVQDYQYGLVSDAYLFDAESREFLERHNPAAMREMSERLLEAIQRGLWKNDHGYRERLEDLLLTLEDRRERAMF